MIDAIFPHGMTTYTLRADLPAPPERIARLPVDKRGFPVPRFVALVEGVPDHRLIEPGYIAKAVRFGLCWICGEPLGRFKTFLVGPLSAINRISSEPPMHRECAHYAACACPFLTKPHMHRREAGLPADTQDPAGEMLTRNPGAMCAWTCLHFRVEVHARRSGGQGVLFYYEPPTTLEWFAEGRAATRAEVMASIESGLPAMLTIAETDGPKAVAMLGAQTGALVKLLDDLGPL